VKLFTDREYVIDEIPEAVRGLPFLRTSIEKTDVRVSEARHALRAHADDSPESCESGRRALLKAGFTKVDVPETQLFPGEINRVSLYRRSRSPRAGEAVEASRRLVVLVHGQSGSAGEGAVNPWTRRS
jgi:hypothetical protein